MAIDFPSSPALNQVYTLSGYSWTWDGESWCATTPAEGYAAPTIRPQGRLTPTSNVSVISADAIGVTQIYYTPHDGSLVPVFTGALWLWMPFTQMTLLLDTANHLAGNVYDVFVWSNNGTISVGTAPAWSSLTARGAGAGTTELQQLAGVWVNKYAVTLKNGAGAGVAGVPANTATYVGSIYCTANGQTGMALSPAAAVGGSNAILGVFNAYNRVPISAMSRDSTGSWTYATTTWRPTNNSANNRVSYLDGLGVLTVRARATVLGETPASTYGGVAVNRDSTVATPTLTSNFGPGTSQQIPVHAPFDFPPSLGFHYIQGMEIRAAGAGTMTFYGAGYQSIVAALDM